MTIPVLTADNSEFERLHFFPHFVARIAIEADGKTYHSSPTQKARDQRKNDYLKKNVWTVLRFSGRQINRELPKVLGKIEE